jgi:5-methylcytosine-specific restriction endonuclease McrA
MYCAEGSASKAGLVEWSFSSKEQDTLGSDSARIIKEVFGLETTEDIDEQEHTCRIRVSSKVLSILVRSLCGRGCQGKKVPWWVARSFPAEFLKGLFLGDACIDSDRSKIALTMTSYEVIFGAQSLLWGQGIYPTVQFGHRPNRKPSWSLVLQGENYSRFMQEILGRNVPQGERIYGNDDFVFRKIQKLTPIEEEVVVVHNLETTGTHSYVANGLSVHNCQFCGQRKPTAELTYDHVIPRAQGGKTCWENIVTACGSCNHLKADRTLEQARVALAAQAKEAAQKGQEREATRLRKAAQSMRLRVEPVRPDWVPIFTVQISKNSMPDSWKSYCEWAMAKAS